MVILLLKSILFVTGVFQYSSSRCFGVMVLKVSAHLGLSVRVVDSCSFIMGSWSSSLVSREGLVLVVSVGRSECCVMSGV